MYHIDTSINLKKPNKFKSLHIYKFNLHVKVIYSN